MNELVLFQKSWEVRKRIWKPLNVMQGITDLSSDAQIALTGNAEYEKKQVENRTQISLVEDLKKYLGHNEYEILLQQCWSKRYYSCRTD